MSNMLALVLGPSLSLPNRCPHPHSAQTHSLSQVHAILTSPPHRCISISPNISGINPPSCSSTVAIRFILPRFRVLGTETPNVAWFLLCFPSSYRSHSAVVCCIFAICCLDFAGRSVSQAGAGSAERSFQHPCSSNQRSVTQ